MKKFMSLVVGVGMVVVFALAFAGAPKVASAGHVMCGDHISRSTTLDEDLNCVGDGLTIEILNHEVGLRRNNGFTTFV